MYSWANTTPCLTLEKHRLDLQKQPKHTFGRMVFSWVYVNNLCLQVLFVSFWKGLCQKRVVVEMVAQLLLSF